MGGREGAQGAGAYLLLGAETKPGRSGSLSTLARPPLASESRTSQGKPLGEQPTVC